MIEVYISGLRRKIDDDEPVKLIHTMRGHGYVLRADALPSASAAKPPQGAGANVKSSEPPKKAVKH